MTHLFRPTLLAGLLILIAGCDSSDDPDDLAPSRAQVTVTQDGQTQSYDGYAYFANDSSTDAGFVLAISRQPLQAGEAVLAGEIYYGVLDAQGKPAEQSYTIISDGETSATEFAVLYFNFNTNAPGLGILALGLADDGTVRITDSSGDTVAGTMSVTGRYSNAQATDLPFSLEVTFNASQATGIAEAL
ncbi:MAG: hypothetical protein AAF752_06810 [Bacteroidota bacterium]